MTTSYRTFLMAAALALGAAARAETPVRINLGTLAPRGSAYHQSLQKMGEAWRDAGVKLVIYPDGTQGGEADMVKLMRVGSLQGGLLTAVGLADRSDSRPSQLSGGQQQRIAVARALAPHPEFILADEPTANLDSKSAESLLDIMEKLNREEDMTFIFSTHDVKVMRRARRVITLEDGKVVSDELKTNDQEPNQ